MGLSRPNSKRRFETAVYSQARETNPNPNFLVRISSGGVGVFYVKGWGPKSSVCPSKPRETKLLGGISRDSCRDILGSSEKFEKKLCSFFVPYPDPRLPSTFEVRALKVVGRPYHVSPPTGLWPPTGSISPWSFVYP